MTIPEIALAYGRKQVTLRKWARRLFVVTGRDYHLTPAQVRRMLAAMDAAVVGRPRKEGA